MASARAVILDMLRRVESVCYLRHLLNNYHLTRLFLFQLLGYYYHLTRLFIVTRILYHLTCFFLCVSFFQFKQLLNCLLILSLVQLSLTLNVLDCLSLIVFFFVFLPFAHNYCKVTSLATIAFSCHCMPISHRLSC